MSTMLRRLDVWLFERFEVPPSSLAVIRMVTGLAIVALVIPRGLWISDAPNLAYRPPLALSAFFSAPPPQTFFISLNVSVWLLGLFLLVGAWTRTVSCLLSGAMVVLNSFEYSFGKIDHDIVFTLLPVVGAAANWGAAYSWDAARRGTPARSQAWPLALFALVIAIMMTRTGLEKAFSGWLDPNAAAVKSHLVRQLLPTGRSTMLATALLPVNSAMLWELADVTAVVLELSFAVALVRRRWWITICAITCLFHLANSVLFSIQFTLNPIAYAVFGRWAEIPALARALSWMSAPAPLLASFIVATCHSLVRSETVVTFTAVRWPTWITSVAILWLAAAIAMVL